MRSFFSFLLSKSFWKSIVIAIVLSIALFWLALWGTDFYTHHGERIKVPNLQGKQLDEVEMLINNSNLAYKVQDSVFNRKAKPGSVIDQFPKSGQEVKRNRVITLTIAAIAPQQVTLKQVKDLSLRQAIGQLSKKGILVEKLEYVSSAYTNLVEGMKLEDKELKNGDKVHKGDALTLIVGKSEGVVFTVPNLVGLSATYAKRKALEAGLNIGKITFKSETEEAHRTSRVSYQSEEVGTAVTPGTAIHIVLKEPKESDE